MEEFHQITLTEWTTWKEEIKQKLTEAAGNFVYIGYRLKQIRDSGMFDGAADIFEFAQREYGMSKSGVSRFIAINEKYSDPQNPLELKREYKGLSSSQLSEMLTLPDNECEMISSNTTIKDIRELKAFNREEKAQKEELEEAEEEPREELTEQNIVEAPVTQTAKATPMDSCIRGFFSDANLKDSLNTICSGEVFDAKELCEKINPSGSRTFKKGICFISFLDWMTGVKVKLMTEPTPRSYTWEQFFSMTRKIFEDDFEAAELAGNVADTWSAAFGKDNLQEPKAEKTEHKEIGVVKVIPDTSVATSQQTFEGMNQPIEIVKAEIVNNEENNETEEDGDDTDADGELTDIATDTTDSGDDSCSVDDNDISGDSQPVTTDPGTDRHDQEEETSRVEAEEEYSEDLFVRRGEMLDRLRKLQRQLNLGCYHEALKTHKHLGWDIEFFVNNG